MTLTRPEQMLLEAISAAVRGEHVAWTEQVSADSWRELIRLSMEQNVLPMVYEAVYACPAAQTEPLLRSCRQSVIRAVTAQTVRTDGLLKLYDALAAQGLHPLVVKGIVCRAIYPNGDSRVSSDEDILIPASEWDACCEALQAYGMETVGSGDRSGHEIGWRKDALYIELHRSLFPPENKAYGALNDFFGDAHTRASAYPAEQGRAVYSMCPHDHLLYLILHAYKHFIHSGFGIRQVCDIGLWAARYGNEIDWEQLYAQCEEAHALLFAAALFRLAKETLHIDIALPEKWAAVEIDPEPMLHDLLNGGVYGGTDMSRRHSASATVNAVAADRSRKRYSVLIALFPTREQLMGQYPELQQHPTRLPIVWLKRIAKYTRELTQHRGGSSTEALRIAAERRELLKTYGIIK